MFALHAQGCKLSAPKTMKHIHTHIIHTYILHTRTYSSLWAYVTLKFFVFQETLEEKFSNVQPAALSFMKVCGNYSYNY